MLSPINKYLAFAFSISLAPSTPLTTLSYSIVFLLGSAFLNYPCNGLVSSYLSSCTSAVSIPPHLSPSEPLIFGVPQGSVLGLSFLNCTPLLSVLSLASLPSHTSFMQTITNSSSLSFPKTSHCYLPLRIYYISHIGCHLTTSLLILPKLNFFLLDFHSKVTKSSTHNFPSLPHNQFLPLPQLRTTDSSSTLTYFFPNKFPLFLAPAITTFVASVASFTL